MVGEFNRENFKMGRPDLGAVQNKIKLPFGKSAGVGRHPFAVGALEAGGGKKKLQFTISVKHIEITGHNNRFCNMAHKGMQIL